jgi:hypothetical protein
MKQISLLLLLLALALITDAKRTHEQFSFDLKFGFIKGGEARFYTKDTIVDGTKLMHATLHAYTTGLANKLYGVNDRFESLIETESLQPIKSSKWLHEQNYKFVNNVYFHHADQKAFSERSGWYNVQQGICDVSSMIYNLRHSGKLNNLRYGQVIEVPFWDTDEWYMLRMKYMGIENIKTSLGTYECIRLEPLSVSGRFFDKKNPMNIWITNDKKKLPVLMQLNFTIGSVKCELNKT